jgi:hypothetical protein
MPLVQQIGLDRKARPLESPLQWLERRSREASANTHDTDTDDPVIASDAPDER